MSLPLEAHRPITMRCGYLGQNPRSVLETNSFRDEGRAAGVIPLDGLWCEGEPCERVSRGLEWKSLSQTYSRGRTGCHL